MADQVEALPGVLSVGVTTRVPLANGGSMGGSFEINDRPAEDGALPPSARYRAIGPGYFASMGITILAGRDVSRADVEDGRAVVWVNETLANAHFEGRITGEGIRWDSNTETPFAEIVGIVADTKEGSLTDEARAEAYLPLRIEGWGYPGLSAASLVVRMMAGQDPSGIIAPVRRIVSEADPTVPLTSTRTMADVVSESMGATSLTMSLLNVASGVALLLGVVGLFGVVSYVVSQRTREIGVRIALGAQRGTVSGMIVRQGLSVAVIGAVLGLAGAFALSRVMEAFLFGVSATDPLTFVSAALLLIAVSLLATWLPARRAAGVDPVEALRSEQ